MSKDDRDKYSLFHFAQANPRGPDQGDIGALLRRVADSVDGLGDIDVQDITFHTQLDDNGEWSPNLVVYYQRAEA